MPSMDVTQERVATPSICTVQAPQSAIPQPNFVPVMPSTSRNTHNRGVSPSTSTVRSIPLTLMVIVIATSRLIHVDGLTVSCSCAAELKRGRPRHDDRDFLFEPCLLSPKDAWV